MSETNDSQLNKNFKIPRRKSNEINTNDNNASYDYNSGNSLVNNSYYEYYNQYTQAQWHQSLSCPQPLQGTSNKNPVEFVAQNICITLATIRERPKNYQKNIFKETVPDVEDQTLPKELTSQFQPLFCKLCSAQLSSNVMAKLHYKSKNHEKKIRKFLQDYSEKTGTPLHPRAKVVPVPKSNGDNDPKWFHCDVCDLPLTGKMHAESHYMGKNHQKVVMGHKQPTGKGFYNEEGKWVRQAPTKRTTAPDGEDNFGLDFKKPKTDEETITTIINNPTPTVSISKFHCSICNVGTTCQEQLDIHFVGQKHKKKLKQLGVIDTSVEKTKSLAEPDVNLSSYRTPSGDYYCHSCNITLSSGVQFKLHIKGKQHLKKTSQKPT